MTYDTINDAVTMQPGAAGALLAGRYRVVRQLGAGGMGSVWLAEDTQLDNKPFAIKMLPSILVSNKRAYRQLKDEALVAMRLVHPNIVQIRAFEENNGNPFLVMDYIEGQTLDDYLGEKVGGNLTQSRREAESQRSLEDGCFGCGIPEEDVIRILKPIAAALDYAHKKGVVHRDVKPGNVMIAKDGTPFILDFGIAREMQETMTRVTGKLSSGTLLYMSPEQLNGESPKPAQDVYSFAAMAYECLKGEPPFVRGAIEDQIKNKIPEPLVGASVSLSCSVMAGLAKKPEDRPSTCAAVLCGGFQRRAVDAQRDMAQMNSAGLVVPRRVPQARRTVPSTAARIDVHHRLGAKDVALPATCIVVALLVLGGAILYRSVQRSEMERKRAFAAQQAEAARLQQEEETQRAEESARKKAQEGKLAWQKKTEEARKKKAEEARKKKAEAERKVNQDATRKKVQLWEGGPYWADRNIGAEEPWASGYYFWWGDSDGYKRVNDEWVSSDGFRRGFSFRWENVPTSWVKGFFELRSITVHGDHLVPEHDAAHIQWGGGWRMPTKQELSDLGKKCDWTWTTLKGVNGYEVRGRGDFASNSIFLPAAGYGDGDSLDGAGSCGYYWSSVPRSNHYHSWHLYFYSSDHYTHSDSRGYGYSVRPVQGFTK